MYMNRWINHNAVRLALVTGLFLVGGTVLAQSVKTNYVPGTNFTKYRTFMWVDTGGQHPDQILDTEIKDAVNMELATKGLTKATGDTADLLVSYQTSVDKQKQWNAYGTGGIGWGVGGMATATSSTIDVGTINLDFYDATAKRLIWQGAATKTINPSENAVKNQKNVEKAMDKLLKDFPPKAKKS